MSEPFLTINLSDIKELEDVFNKINIRTANLTEPFMDIGEHLVNSIHRNFDVGGRPAWKPSKRAQNGGKTLVDKGTLHNSITYMAGRLSVEVGSNMDYAAVHQFGGQAGRNRRVKIPARPFLVVQNEDMDYIVKTIREYVEGL